MALLKSGWHRIRTSIGGEVSARLDTALAEHTARELEMQQRLADLSQQMSAVLAQLSDVFKELALISEANGDLRHALAAMDDRVSGRLAELSDTVDVSIDVDNQSTELLGRLLASARARLDALEEAAGHLS